MARKGADAHMLRSTASPAVEPVFLSAVNNLFTAEITKVRRDSCSEFIRFIASSSCSSRLRVRSVFAAQPLVLSDPLRPLRLNRFFLRRLSVFSPQRLRRHAEVLAVNSFALSHRHCAPGAFLRGAALSSTRQPLYPHLLWRSSRPSSAILCVPCG